MRYRIHNIILNTSDTTVDPARVNCEEERDCFNEEKRPIIRNKDGRLEFFLYKLEVWNVSRLCHDRL